MIQRVSPEISEENAHSRESAAPGAADGAETGLPDTDIQTLIEHWPTLPEAIRSDILAMVREANGED